MKNLIITKTIILIISMIVLVAIKSSAQCPTVDFYVTQEPHTWGTTATVHVTGTQNINPLAGETAYMDFTYVQYSPDSTNFVMSNYTTPLVNPVAYVDSSVDSFTIRVDVLYLTLNANGLIISGRYDSSCVEYKKFARTAIPICNTSFTVMQNGLDVSFVNTTQIIDTLGKNLTFGFMWLFGDNTFSFSTDSTNHLYSNTGTYIVTLWELVYLHDSMVCGMTVSDTLYVQRLVSSINETKDIKTNIFCFNNIITINSEDVIRDCEIYNMIGQLIQKNEILSDGETKIEVSLSTGYYIVLANLLNGQQIKTKIAITQ